MRLVIETLPRETVHPAITAVLAGHKDHGPLWAALVVSIIHQEINYIVIGTTLRSNQIGRMIFITFKNTNNYDCVNPKCF